MPGFTGDLMTLQELYSLPAPEQHYLIEKLLPAGGITMLAGKPKCGKSTIARQVIASVIAGQPFLGFASRQAGALYFALEEWMPEVSNHFRDLKLIQSASLFICPTLRDKNWIDTLRSLLHEKPEIKLVVLDPLFLGIRVRDTNEYAPVLDAIAPLRDIARTFEVAILLVHHTKKTQSADAGDNLLGSTALRGSVDATWQIIKKEDQSRTFQTEMRYGKDMPPTALIFNEETRTSDLGRAEAEIERMAEGATRSRIEEEMVYFLSNNPQSSRDEILGSVPGKAVTKLSVFRELERRGWIVSSGGGVRGDRFLYDIHIPQETNGESQATGTSEASAELPEIPYVDV